MRPLLEESLRNGVLNMVFRVHGKAVAFAFASDILDIARKTSGNGSSAKARVKQRLDNDLMAPYAHLIKRRGEIACPTVGIASEFMSSREFLTHFASELAAYLHLMGYEKLATLMYSPAILHMHEQLLGGYLADELDRSLELPDGSGRHIQPSKHLCFSLAFLRLDAEHLAAHLPQALQRTQELKKFEMRLVEALPKL